MGADRSLDDTAAAAWSSETAPDDDSDTLPEGQTPTRLGRYRIVDVLGTGGMGIVYTGIDEELDRKVALKLLRTDRYTPQARARLVREAQMMARLSHPNVVTVYETGGTRDAFFIAMEFVPGQTLKEWIETANPDWREVVQKLYDAGRGLAAAHGEGVVHRDFKPGNILVAEDGRVRVMDFGVARGELDDDADFVDFDEESADTVPMGKRGNRSGIVRELPALSELTATGMVMGTAPYIAPEVYGGARANPLSDQFSFCVTLWEAVFRRRPFRGESVLEVVSEITSRVIPPLPASPKVPRALQRILTRGIHPDPRRRYRNMEALLADLEPLCEARFGKAAWVTTGAAAVAVAVAVVSFTGSTPAPAVVCDGGADAIGDIWNDGRRAEIEEAFERSNSSDAAAVFAVVSRELDKYAASWAAGYDQICTETQIQHVQTPAQMAVRMDCMERRRGELRALTNLFAAADHSVVGGAAAAVFELIPPERCRASSAPSSATPEHLREAAMQIRAEISRARALEYTGTYAKGAEVAREAHKRAVESDYAPLQAEALLALGRLEWRAGQPADARTHLMRAAELGEETQSVSIKTEAWVELVWVSAWELGATEEGLIWWRLAEASMRANPNLDMALRARLLKHAGAPLHRLGKYEEGLKKVLEAVRLRKELYGGAHPAVADVLNSSGSYYMGLEQFDNAEAQFRASLDILDKTVGGHHPGVAYAQTNLGTLYANRGQPDKAREHYKRALDLGMRLLGPDHAEVGVTLSNLGALEGSEGNFEAAIDYIQRALTIERRRLGDNHPNLATSYENLAAIYSQVEDVDNAVASCAKALAIRAQHTDATTQEVRDTIEWCESLVRSE